MRTIIITIVALTGIVAVSIADSASVGVMLFLAIVLSICIAIDAYFEAKRRAS